MIEKLITYYHPALHAGRESRRKAETVYPRRYAPAGTSQSRRNALWVAAYRRD